ncbi:MAG: 4Fe-4S dicluster domain-containing protein, partial [Actinobacteria bacterium]|nr:4Fe-4S dicluster domain-containing protein [Actinomycetota bacterium]
MTQVPRAFDARRPPDPDLIADCVHCGFCLPTCPTYALWGEEMDSPRGRIVLMHHGLEEGSDMAGMAIHFDRCLGCMACVTACPSGVQYDRLIEATRPQVERNLSRPLRERLFRKALFALFTHPGRLRAVAPLLAARRLATGRLVSRSSRLRALASLAPDVRVTDAWRRLPERIPAQGRSRARVGFLQGCVQRVFFHRVNQATVRVLAAEGFDVFAPRLPRCCGALMLHSGYEDDALVLAKRLIETFEECDVVAVNSAGCGSSMKDYGHLLADDPEWGDRAHDFSAKVRDVSELLAREDTVARRHPIQMRIAYHDACHLAHAQAVREEPRALLRGIPGIEVVE